MSFFTLSLNEENLKLAGVRLEGDKKIKNVGKGR